MNVESSNYYKISEFIHKFIEKNQPIFIDMLKINIFLILTFQQS